MVLQPKPQEKKTSKQFENPLDILKNKCYNKDVRSRETAQPQKKFSRKNKKHLDKLKKMCYNEYRK